MERFLGGWVGGGGGHSSLTTVMFHCEEGNGTIADDVTEGQDQTYLTVCNGEVTYEFIRILNRLFLLLGISRY